MISKLLEKLKIKTDNKKIYKMSLTHSSYANEHNLLSNERLEFLGDAVLELLFSKYLYEKYPLKDEGFLTKVRAKMVCEEALVQYASDISLKEYLYLGKGEQKNELSNAIIADAFEALLGAIFLDKGLDVAFNVFNEIIIKNKKNKKFTTDYKTILQEHYAIKKGEIKYKLVKERGPAHKKVFASVCLINNKEMGYGVGTTKKESEQNAAKEALKKDGINDY